jgi:hypothetical protein
MRACRACWLQVHIVVRNRRIEPVPAITAPVGLQLERQQKLPHPSVGTSGVVRVAFGTLAKQRHKGLRPSVGQWNLFVGSMSYIRLLLLAAKKRRSQTRQRYGFNQCSRNSRPRRRERLHCLEPQSGHDLETDISLPLLVTWAIRNSLPAPARKRYYPDGLCVVFL